MDILVLSLIIVGLFSFSPFNLMLAVHLFYISFIIFRYMPLIPVFRRQTIRSLSSSQSSLCSHLGSVQWSRGSTVSWVQCSGVEGVSWESVQ